MRQYMMLSSDKGVPIPDYKKGRPTGQQKYPFDELEAGDSFLIEGKTPSGIAGCYNAAKRRNKGKKFTARTVDGVLCQTPQKGIFQKIGGWNSLRDDPGWQSENDCIPL
jgi:hypothetical protein